MGAEHVRLHLDERLVDQAEDLGHEAVQDQTARENNRASLRWRNRSGLRRRG